jgi:glycosyltransferase involved in cell wall biosynthesis
VKIAYIYDNVYPYCIGGVEKRIWEISKCLINRGHEVHFFCMNYWDGEEVIRKEGIWYHGVCPLMPLFQNDRRSIKQAIIFACKSFFPLLNEKYDIIDCQSSPYFPAIFAWLASVLRHSCLVITWHEVWDDYWYEYLGMMGICGKTVERFVSRLPHHAISVSQFTKEKIANMRKTDDISVIPNGIDFKRINNISPSGNVFDVIYAGRLIKEKGVDLLIKAVDVLKRKKQDISCLIIGDGPEKNDLQAMVNDLNLNRNILFKGFLKDQNDLIAYIKSSRVFVLPSKREGFGIVVIEANACGTPVVTTNYFNNAAKDLIQEGKNGYLCDLHEVDLAEKILLALSKNDWESDCKEKANQYDWHNIVLELEQYYASLI